VKKIKILRIIARLNIGGPARHVVYLSEGLPDERYTTTLAYGSLDLGEGDMSYLARERNIKSFFIPELSRKINPLRDLKAFLKIYSIMRMEKPDIVHTHTAKAGTLGRLAAILAGIPIKVHTYHGHVFHGYFSKRMTFVFLWIERFLSIFTDRIIAISEKQKNELLDFYKIGNEQKYSIVSLGFEMHDFLNAHEKSGRFKREHNFRKDDILIGTVGRLVPVKNHPMLIRIAHKLKKKIPPEVFKKVKFVVIGNGPEKDKLKEYAASCGIGENFLFLGWVKDIASAYADLDIVTLTSRNEGTPLSLIEAFASGKPVIATDVGGVSNVLGGFGVLVQKDDEAAFTNHLAEFILSFPGSQDAGTRGKEYVAERFSTKTLIRNVDKVYSELLSKKGI